MSDPYPKPTRRAKRRRGRIRTRRTAKRVAQRKTRTVWAIRGQLREPACRRCGNPFVESHHMYARGVSGGANVDEDWNHISLCGGPLGNGCHAWAHGHRIAAQAAALLAHWGDACGFAA